VTVPAKPEVHSNLPVPEQTYRDPREVLAEKLEQPADIERQLQTYDRNRKALVRFIDNHLQEASYEEKNGKKLPKAGEMRDYYMVPGATTKALTKLGAEKLGQLFRFFRGTTEVTHQVCTKEICEIRVRVTLVDQYSRPVGAFESACTSQERSFQFAKKKYDDDFRAALNDIVARASKRAFVQAMIYSTATDEIFQAGADPDEQKAETERPAAERQRFRFPRKISTPQFAHFAGKQIDDATITAVDLVALVEWCKNTKTNDPKSLAHLRTVTEEELERRRTESEPLDEDDEVQI
jgi:hypothetical protein